MADAEFLSKGLAGDTLPVSPEKEKGENMDTLTLFVIIAGSILAVIVWCILEDDRDERR